MNKSTYQKKPNNTENVEVLLYFKKIINFKKKIKLNAEFEFVKMGKGMTGILISDSFAIKILCSIHYETWWFYRFSFRIMSFWRAYDISRK